MGLKFFQIDVFTNKAFGGNPLAVFPDSEGLAEALHIQIAREMNLSETVFIYPANDPEADFKVRIFTPGKEIPFAGHPTLGTAHILWETGKIPREQKSLTLEMGAGLVKVHKTPDGLFMDQPDPNFGHEFESINQIAEALSLVTDQIDSRFPMQIVSTGFPALYVPLKTLSAVQNVIPNLSVLKPVLKDVDMIYVFTGETEYPQSTVHSRSFAPFIGIPEDPATGSAAGALGAYLFRHRVFENLDPSKIVIEQGIEMKRPSRILVRVEGAGSEIDSIQVGGQSVTVLQGNLL
ncbi:MAG: PhzF family phenazine biosynthesis protein [Nitrospinota bacterium]|nr:PhzF family phenazine biosynthesis protein [Nitrospinota bacterium]